MGSGEIYRGDWMMSEMHGYGESISVDGDTFQGQYEHNKRHGFGRITIKKSSKTKDHVFKLDVDTHKKCTVSDFLPQTEAGKSITSPVEFSHVW